MTRPLICTDLVTNVFLKIEKLHIYFVLEEFRFPKKWESYSMLFLWSGYSVPQSVQSKFWKCSAVFVLSKNLSERSIILLWESLRSSGVKIQCCYKGFCLKKIKNAWLLRQELRELLIRNLRSQTAGRCSADLIQACLAIWVYLSGYHLEMIFEYMISPPLCLLKNC